MRRLRDRRLWASIGLLVTGSAMPYCSAATRGVATQHETSIAIRADVLAGVVLSWVGFAILTVVGSLWLWRARRRREAVRA